MTIRSTQPIKARTGDPRAVSGHAGPPRLALDEIEAAQALGISQRHLAEQRALGLVPFSRIGKRIVYPVHVLVEWLGSIAEQPQPERTGD